MRFPRRSVVGLALLLTSVPACQAEATQPGVRPPECADDMWYPSTAAALSKAIDGYLAEASPPNLTGKPAALICPHAGIKYSGPVAATAYKTLKGHAYKRVIVLGLSHRHTFSGGAILPKVTAYATPLGNIPLDRAACDQLLALDDFAPHEQVHRGEHSLEIQLPFLQRVISGFQLVPIMVGSIELKVYDRMADAIAPLLDDQTLVVASSDFTHYGRQFMFVPFTENVPENLKRIDFSASEAIMTLDAGGFLRTLKENGAGNPDYRVPQTICGRGPITLLTKILNRAGTYKGIRLAYDTSGRMTNDWRHSVSYMAIGFVKTGDKPKVKASAPASEDDRLTNAERNALLQIARDAATAALKDQGRFNPHLPKYTLTDRLKHNGAAFVTLRNHDRLRGCIGAIVAREPLVDSVANNAMNAATKDYRFASNPVTLAEMPSINIEISVMSPLRQVNSPSEIVLGKHGVVLTRGLRRSVYLPQVATETGWNRETFLSRLSAKAGLPPDAWQRHGTRLEVFTADVFGEPEESHASTSQ